MAPRVCSFDGLLKWLIASIAILFLFNLATCGGGGGKDTPPPEDNVTITGVVDDGGDNTAVGNLECRFVDKTGQKRDYGLCDRHRNFELIVPPDLEGYIYCGPQLMTNLNLTTFSSTVGFQAGETKRSENVTPATTVAADIIRIENPSDPESRKAQIVSQSQTEPNLSLVTEMAGRLYREMVEAQVNTNLGNDHGDGGDPDPEGPDDGGGVGGEAGDGADFSPLTWAKCVFVVGDYFDTAVPIRLAALADYLKDGELTRPDLAGLDVEPPDGKSTEDIQRAFNAIFGPDGLGETLTAPTDEEGRYFLATPPNLAGYVRCVPQDHENLIVGTYIPGRRVGEAPLDQDVTPATTVFSTVIAPQLDQDKLGTVKENYLSDIDGLKVLLDWPGYPDGSLEGFNVITGPNTNPEVGLVAFSATALFNIFYKNGLDVDFLAAIEDMVDERAVDPAYLETQGVSPDQVAAITTSIDTVTGEEYFNTTLPTALFTTRIYLTVMDSPDGTGLIQGAVVTVDESVVTCVEGCGHATDSNGQLSLTLRGVSEEAIPVTVTVSSVPGYSPYAETVDVVAFATVDHDVVLPTTRYTLTVQTDGDGSGRVTSTPAGINCDDGSGTCSATFASSTPVTLSADPDPGSTFGGWSGDCTNEGTSCNLSMDANATVTASFTSGCSDGDVTIDPPQTSFDTGGGSGSIQVTDPGNCGWTATENASWIIITSGASGSGSGTVSYSVSSNASTSQRSTVITIAGRSHTVTQAPASCTYSVSPTNRSFDNTSGTGSIAVTAGTGCSWTASEGVSWINITSGGTGSGDGTVNYSVLANSSTTQRSAEITIAGQSHTVTQAGSACTYSISPTSRSFTASSGTGSVAVTAGTGCSWTASEGVSWISITSGGSGSGDGTVNYSVLANSSTTQRSAEITIAGQSHTVTQAGSACTYSISPTSRSFTASSGTGSVAVTAGAGCSWTASEGVSWISITSGGSGSGDGTVNYSVLANSSTSQRSAVITIAGRSHTVTQAGLSCTYSISPTSRSFTASSGTGSVTVTAGAGCSWTSSEGASWISITSGSSGSGNGSVNYSVSTNGSTSQRSAVITVAGRSHTVTQAGVSVSLPDYIVSSLYLFTNSFSAGERFDFRFRIENQGGTPQNCMYMALYLSTDANITTSDTLIRDWDFEFCNLAAGDEIAQGWEAWIPTGASPGSYYIGCIVDVYRNEAESNENNNTFALPITIVSSTPCSTQTEAGSDTPETHTYSMGRTSGTFEFYYQTYSQRDRIIVSYEGATLFDTGCVGASGTRMLSYSGSSSNITVAVQPNCAGGSGTDWNFTVYCPD